MAGIIKRYITTIKSPDKLFPGKRIDIHSNVDARVAAASPNRGAIRKPVLLALSGTVTSFPISLSISQKG
jgi:hypothetical protein